MTEPTDSPANSVRALAEKGLTRSTQAAGAAGEAITAGLRRAASPEARAAAEQGARAAGVKAAHANRWFWGNAPLDWVAGLRMGTSPDLVRTRLANAQRDVAAAGVAVQAAKAELARQAGLAQARNATRQGFTARRRAALVQDMEHQRAALPLHMCGWDDRRWKAWEPQAGLVAETLRVGTRPGPLGVAVPILLPFIGRGRTVVIRHSDATEARARDMVGNLVLRMALAMPFDLRLTLIDPKTLGRAFPLAARLPRKRPDEDDLRRLMQTIKGEIRDVGNKVVGAADGFEAVPEAERGGYGREAVVLVGLGEMQAGEGWLLSDLKQIAPNGPACGRYLVLTHNSRFELRDTGYDQLGDVAVVDLDNLGGIVLDAPAGQDWAQQALGRTSQAEPPRPVVTWADAVGVPPHTWWKADATHQVQTPVGQGRRGVWFGERREEGSCVHGLVAGTAGSGKSKLLHTVILGLAERYSPAELQMLLVDGKGGVEFQAYRDLPHARVVSLRTAPVFALAVLEYLHEQMRERFALFASAGVAGYAAWREQDPARRLPRLLLIADEYQQFFEKDPMGASTLLANLSAQGRAAGVHVLLASQRFTAQGMTQVETIMKNMHLRVALRTPDARSLSEFGPRGKAEIEQLTAPGVAVLNDKAGADPNSERVAIVPVEPVEIAAVVQALAARAAADPALQGLPRPVVFDGTDQPPPSANRVVAGLARPDPARPDAPVPQRLAELARTPREAGGLGFAQWLAADSPLVLWLGQAYSVHGHLPVMLRRSGGQALLAVGDMGVLHHTFAGALAGLAVTAAPGRVRLDVVDASVPGTPGHGVLAAVCDGVLRPAGLDTASGGDADAVLQAYLAELERRRANPQGTIGDPSWLLVLLEPERAPALRRAERGVEVGGLRALLRDGPERGLHVLLATASARTLAQVLDERRDLQLVDHRIALQMSDADSITVLGNREAARLNQVAQGRSAVYFNVAQGLAEYFKPYYAADEGGDARIVQDIRGMVGA